jgi:hypothetical protein
MKSHYRRLSSELIQFNQLAYELDSSQTDKALNSTLSSERRQHRRQPSIIIKEASQTYSFASMLDSLMESSENEEDLVLSPLSPVSVDYTKQTQPVGSFGASTMEPKSSLVHSEMKSSVALSELDKRLSTIYTGSHESVPRSQRLFESKPNSAFNYETQVQVSGTFCTSSFGAVSTGAFCMRCNKEVVTRVTVQSAKLSL